MKVVRVPRRPGMAASVGLAAALVLGACGGGPVVAPSGPPSTASVGGTQTPTSTPIPVPTLAATAVATAVAGCAPMPSGIVAWWRAEGDASDESGTNDGTAEGGAGYAAGVVGRAFAFDGVGQFVEVTDASELQLRSGITIEGWIYAAGAPAPYAGIAGTWNDNGVASRTYLLWALNGRVEWILSRDGGETPRVVDTEGLPVDRWVHIAGTFDGSTLRLYRDGVEVASTPLAGELAINALPFRIGRTEGGSVGSNFWRGSIDELSVYDRALDADEIAAIHEADAAGKCDA